MKKGGTKIIIEISLQPFLDSSRSQYDCLYRDVSLISSSTTESYPTRSYDLNNLRGISIQL